MRVLVACEFSGIVRDAFIKRGHDAVSCDLLTTDKPGPHYQGDVMNIINDSWDMMIAFPPCTHLCVSGARWFKDKIDEQNLAIKFFKDLINCGIPRIAIENPIGIMSTRYRKPDQIIHPWMFGHPEQKATCLWLNNLPKLQETNNVYNDMTKLSKRERESTQYAAVKRPMERAVKNIPGNSRCNGRTMGIN